MTIGIYSITNKLNGKMYIGQSINMEQRWTVHRNENNWRNYKIYHAFRKYGIENFVFKIEEQTDLHELNVKEQEYIKKYNSLNQGYNMTLGGDARINSLPSEEIKEIKKLILEKKLSLKEIAILFDVTLSQISKINRGVLWKDDKISYPLRPYKKPVYQIDINTLQILEEYESCHQAGRETNCDYRNIWAACSGKTKTAYGFGWIFCENKDTLTPDLFKYQKNTTGGKPKSVLMIDIVTEEIIQEFPSAREAANFIKGDSSCITKVCRGKRQTHQNYKWKYKEETQ